MSSLSFIVLHTPGTLSSRNGLKIFLSKWITGVKLLYLQRWPHDLHLESRKVYCARERDSFFTVSTSVHVLRSPFDFPDLLLYILFKLFRPLEFHLEQYHAGSQQLEITFSPLFRFYFHEVLPCYSIKEST